MKVERDKEMDLAFIYYIHCSAGNSLFLFTSLHSNTFHRGFWSSWKHKILETHQGWNKFTLEQKDQTEKVFSLKSS